MSEWNIKGKNVLITGATNGIGQATALELARQGANVNIVSRNEEHCRATQKMIERQTGQTINYYVADLSSQKQIRKFAEQFLAEHERLDVLVNNAGVFIRDRQESIDGIEMTFALNHLGYFLLTNLLLERIRASTPARIISVSSAAHITGRMNFDDLEFKKKYHGFKAYSQSKLANILFTVELARKLKGTGLTANCLHPGIVNSGFGKQGGEKRAGISKFNALGISPENGAGTSIYLATSPEVSGITGKYFSKRKVKKPHRRAQDVEAQKRLWDLSLGMVGKKQRACLDSS